MNVLYQWLSCVDLIHSVCVVVACPITRLYVLYSSIINNDLIHSGALHYSIHSVCVVVDCPITRLYSSIINNVVIHSGALHSVCKAMFPSPVTLYIL